MFRIIRYILVLLVILLLIDRLSPPETTIEMQEEAEVLASAIADEIPPQPFVYDGCSLWPDTLPGHDLQAACLRHDQAYWVGGNDAERKVSDLALKDAISHTGPAGPMIGSIMYTGVRLFGDSPLARIFNVNWAFGWNK